MIYPGNDQGRQISLPKTPVRQGLAPSTRTCSPRSQNQFSNGNNNHGHLLGFDLPSFIELRLHDLILHACNLIFAFRMQGELRSACMLKPLWWPLFIYQRLNNTEVMLFYTPYTIIPQSIPFFINTRSHLWELIKLTGVFGALIRRGHHNMLRGVPCSVRTLHLRKLTILLPWRTFVQMLQIVIENIVFSLYFPRM